MKNDQTGHLLTILMGGACIVVIVAGIKVAADLLNNIFLAWLLANSITPFPKWLMRKRCPQTAAVLVTLFVVIVGGLVVASLFGLSISGLAEKLPVYQARLTEMFGSFKSLSFMKGIDIDTIKSLDMLTPAKLVGYARMLLSGLGGLLGNVLLILFLVAILLFEFVEKGDNAGETRSKAVLLNRFLEASRDVKTYVAITGAMGFMQATANTILLAALGVDFPITWGILFFFCNFIPAFGFLIALIPPALIAYLESGWKVALAVVIGYVVLNFIGDNIIKPRFMKKGLDISILAIVLSLLFWSWVLGSIGTILAVPLTLTVRNLIVYYMEKSPQPQD